VRRVVCVLVSGLSLALAVVYFLGQFEDSPTPPAARDTAAPPNSSSAPSVLAIPSAPTEPADSRQRIQMLTPRAVATRQPATDAVSLPLREAIDSGRAQPVFLSIAAPSAIRAGTRFTALINAETENDVSRIAFTLQYDPRIVRVLDASAGDFMAQARASAKFSYAQDPAGGRLSIELEQDPSGPPVSGGGSIAAIDMVALVEGTSELALATVAMFNLNNEGVAFSLPQPHPIAIRN
jgi:cohesin domain-containing protein